MEEYKLIEDEYPTKKMDSELVMASRYYLGQGVEKDEAKAFQMFMDLAEKGEPMAQHNMGCFYEKGLCGQLQDYRKALAWFKKAADQGLKESQFLVGLYYYRGEGIDPDIKIAIEYLTKSAEQGFLDAQQLLGEIYYMGNDNVESDIKEAIKWLEKAADQGDFRSKYNLAHIYFTTYGYIKADDNKIISWLEPAAKNGMVEAQVYLGMLYHRRRRFSDALMWLTKASKQNNRQATSFLAVYYHLGLGTTKNSEITKELINKLVAANLAPEDDSCEDFDSQRINDGPYTEKDMQSDLANNSYKVATELGLYAECDEEYDEAIRFYNEASWIALNQPGMESKHVESQIRIAKIFEKIDQINIARSLYNQAKWRALGDGSFAMYNTVAIQELGMALSQIKKDGRENSSINYIDFIQDILKSALDHYNERECLLYGKCSSSTDERRIKDIKEYGYNKKNN